MVIEELINKYYDDLNDSDLHIWKYIHKNKKKCSTLPIENLAEQCNVSRTTILRFSKKLRFNGYSELKYCLRNDLDKSENVVYGNVINVDDMCDNYIKAINDLKKKDFTNICKMIHEAHNIFLIGTGTIQKGAAKEFQRLFYGMHKYTHIVDGSFERNMLLKGITSNDLVIIISLTGEGEEVTTLCKELRVRNVPVLSITQLASNRLANNSSENLYILTKNLSYGNHKEHVSISLIFIMIEILYVRFVNYIEEIENRDI